MGEACDIPPSTLEDDADYDDMEGRNIELDFGTLEIFKERTKCITFYRPMTDEDITYKVKQSHMIKTIKSNFELDHYKGVLKPNQDFEMAVTYKPTLASIKDLGIFNYTDSDSEIIKITLSGVAVGPHCTFSAKNLEFYRTPEWKLSEHKVEINNDSAATARFKIDHPSNDIFRIEPLEGSVKPNSYQYITVRFCPKKPGIFARKIFCLVWNSEPLVLNVFGRYSTTVGLVNAVLKHHSIDQSFGFQAYMDDSLTTRKNEPPFALTTYYLNFGCVLVNGNQPRTQVTSMTNHLNNPIQVDWDRGHKSEVFKITPAIAEIPAGACAQFEVQFNPEENYNVFQESMVAQIRWNLKTTKPCVPLTCMMRAQGHSFPDNQGWIAHVDLCPEMVYFQPCAPGEVANTTFSLRNKTHLPVLYTLVPPKKTNIIAKPMMGKFRNREIIVVQLQTEIIKVKIYIEEWKIVINGREERPMTIYFHGETSVPTIEIGRKNKINAGPVQDGSKKEIDVMMKNTSYFSINYQFQLIKKSILAVSPTSGILPANESVKLTIKITGSQCAPKKETFLCEMRIIDGNGAISGDSHDTEIDIFTECSYSELCACPSSKNFGRVAYGLRVKTEFEAANFGDTPIFFQTCQSGEEQHDKNFRIKPCFGEIKPKCCKRFSINGIISLVGHQTLEFGYYNRIVKDSPLVSGEPISLFKLSYSAEFPVIQIEEIVEHNFGGLFGKADFYKHYLKISKLNRILREIQNDQTIEVQLRLPEFELQKKEFYIKLALTNITDFNTTVMVQRKKLCDCKLEEMSAGMSERKKGFNCPHRACLNMELQDSRFFPKITRFLTIKVKYCLREETQMCYSLQLRNNRIIDLYFNIYSIPPEIQKLSIYKREFEFMLKDVYLGTRVAPVQMFWMYNNTRELLNVEFDTQEVEHLCRIDGFKVLEILNPVDQILPYNCKPLLVKFHPIEQKIYSVEIEVKHYFPGNEPVLSNFLIEGQGIMDFTNQPDIIEIMPRMCKFSSNFPISLSLEYIEVKMLPVWSRRKELIFIKNNSRGKIIQYVWGMVKMDNIIEITTEVKFSMLLPKEIQPVVIIIKSFSEPCIATLRLPCEVTYYSDKVIHQITKEKNLEAESRINDFMYGEPSWAKRPINPIEVLENPETLFASVVIEIKTVHTKDLDQNMDASIQIKQYPNQSIENIPKSLLRRYYPEEKPLSFPEKEKTQPTINVSERVMFCRVLEDVVSDVLFSDLLKSLLQKSTKAPMHKYNEFIMDDKKIMETKVLKSALSNQDIQRYRKREIENVFNQLKITEVSNILQTLIYESILRLVQCQKPDFNIKELNDKIEKSLYTCKNKSCSCNKSEDT